MTKAKRIFKRHISPLAAVLMLALLWQHFYDDAERMYFCIDDAYKDIFYQAKMK